MTDEHKLSEIPGAGFVTAAIKSTSVTGGHPTFKPESDYIMDEDNSWENVLLRRMDDIDKKIDRILDHAAKSESLITKIANAVEPTLNQLMKSPLLKMLGVKN